MGDCGLLPAGGPLSRGALHGGHQHPGEGKGRVLKTSTVSFFVNWTSVKTNEAYHAKFLSMKRKHKFFLSKHQNAVIKLCCKVVKDLVKIDKMFKIDFIDLNESRMIQLQFATKRIKIGPSEPEIQPAKGARRRYPGPMTSRDVISLAPVTISLVTLHYWFLTVEEYTKEAQVISGTQLTYRIQTL